MDLHLEQTRLLNLNCCWNSCGITTQIPIFLIGDIIEGWRPTSRRRWAKRYCIVMAELFAT
ncbi:hypothetical protein C0Z18_12460 [Trinickia dabaoshanensis]|uniref:Uncharacterized protein n=1 Tax=Trinickia dabaoshanensis TaxID=564714 RepID=A0A2N7VR72_9BURK|nr:hypothetical protein C0Z18_12460 [Trinickia dabaoshanensis]